MTFLSDNLKDMRTAFALADLDGAGVSIGAEDLRTVVEQFDAAIVEAKDLENDLSRHEWNDAGRADRQVLDTLALIDGANSGIVVQADFATGDIRAADGSRRAVQRSRDAGLVTP